MAMAMHDRHLDKISWRRGAEEHVLYCDESKAVSETLNR
jgi:hypothetical protein